MNYFSFVFLCLQCKKLCKKKKLIIHNVRLAVSYIIIWLQYIVKKNFFYLLQSYFIHSFHSLPVNVGLSLLVFRCCILFNRSTKQTEFLFDCFIVLRNLITIKPTGNGRTIQESKQESARFVFFSSFFYFFFWLVVLPFSKFNVLLFTAFKTVQQPQSFTYCFLQ